MIKEFGLQENIARNVIAIDGISRCGKSILSSIIPSLEGVEQLRFITLLEHVVPALALGVMDKSCARSSMRTLMNEIAYDTMLSRNANFRPGDLSGITNYARPGIYVERLTREEGPPVIEELRNKHEFMHESGKKHDCTIGVILVNTRVKFVIPGSPGQRPVSGHR